MKFAITVLLFLAFFQNAVAADCNSLFNVASATVEFETTFTPGVMSIITTDDETLLPLVGTAADFPKLWIGLAQELGMENATNEEVQAKKFDSLSYEQKLNLLKRVAFDRDQSDYRRNVDTKIRGLKIKPEAAVRFPFPTYFLGKKYPAGRHVIDISKHIYDGVSYVSIEDMKYLSGVELHFRNQGLGGDVLKDARNLFLSLDVKVSSHTHLVAPIPKFNYKYRTAHSISYHLTDFVMRANLFSEMLINYLYGAGIPTVVRSSGVEDSMRIFTQSNYNELYRVFFNYYHANIQLDVGDYFKMGFVGMRGTYFYDQPDRWGLEYRVTPEMMPTKLVQLIQNSIHKSMLKSDFGRGHHEKARVTSPHNSFNAIEKWSSDAHREFDFLTFNWKNTWLFNVHPELAVPIQLAQGDAIQKLKASDGSDESYAEIMQEFYRASGLLLALAESLGIDLKEFKRHVRDL